MVPRSISIEYAKFNGNVYLSYFRREIWLEKYIITIAYDNRFIKDFKEKAELSNLFFSKLCFLISHTSSPPSYINYTTEKFLSTVTLSVEAIGNIIQNLDSNKADGNDNISVRMLKICGDAIYE